MRNLGVKKPPLYAVVQKAPNLAESPLSLSADRRQGATLW
jgi:hypothetical protein